MNSTDQMHAPGGGAMFSKAAIEARAADPPGAVKSDLATEPTIS